MGFDKLAPAMYPRQRSPVDGFSPKFARCLPLLALIASCSSRGGGSPAALDPLVVDTNRAQILLKGGELPDRFEVVALADRLAVAAVKAGPGAGSGALLRDAARLRERVFRVSHGEADGREAVALLERSIEAAPAQSCDLGVDRALLLAEINRDPALGLREANGALGTSPPPTCQTRVEALSLTLAPYRDRAGIPRGPAAPAGGPAPEPPEQIVASPDPPPPSSTPVSLLSFETYGDKEAARIVLRLSGPTSFKAGTAPPLHAGSGPRVYVDIARSKIAKMRRETVVGGLVERVRVAPHGDGTRVVLDLAKTAVRRVFYLPDPFRVVIDVSSRPDRFMAQAPGIQKGKREVRRVVLDPGHGGTDPGATGPSGLLEKDVSLDIAHRAAPVLSREMGIVTLLTRDRDEFVSLEERTARANAFSADLFLSIHCNASESSSAHGIQTYVLDTTSDEIAARVAARENNAPLAQAGGDVARLLGSLRLADLGSRSTHLADLLQRSAMASLGEKYPGASDQGVKTAGFYVLVGAQMPAILFETSFISNPLEESRLGSTDYRQRLADAVVNAVKAYREGL